MRSCSVADSVCRSTILFRRYHTTHVREILFQLRKNNVKIGAASRTQAPRVAMQALEGLMITPKPSQEPVSALSLFDYMEIYPGSKVAHFRRLAELSGIPFHEMRM